MRTCIKFDSSLGVSSTMLAVLLVACTLASASAQQRNIDWQWKRGRASYFGEGLWPIHIGGCNYGYLWKDEPIGWDVAALSDVHDEYVGSCGACYEVKCDNSWTQDNFGQKYDRSSACYDTSASVVVRIVDTCQCTYLPNIDSNKRWCCGDVDHLDMSKWSFEKLAELRWGVIALQYRQVPCDYQPPKLAKALAHPSPDIPAYPPSDARRVTRDWPELRSKEIETRVVFENNLENMFKSVSWNAWVQPLADSKNSGMLGGPGLCATIRNNGAVALQSWKGIFQKAVLLEFWTYVGEVYYDGSAAQVPDITINIGGDKGGCKPVRIMDLKPVMFQPRCRPYCRDYWWGYKVYLPAFAGSDPMHTVINNPNDFNGCGGMSDWDLNRIEFRHDGYGGLGDKWVCFDHIMVS